MNGKRPPYGAAVLAGLIVLVIYLVTLAPSVTFWDAGEFIAAAHGLGIPHPPGTPLFILLAHVWGLLIPFGEYAFRLNLLSAVCGAIAAGCWFLVAHSVMERRMASLGDPVERVLPLGAGAAAASFTAFGFTMWQNAVETEVYAVATLTIAIAAWLTIRWREARETSRGARLLLMVLYLGGISIGNHLLALLVGPAIVVALVAEAWARPLSAVGAIRDEWARIGVLAAVWMLLIALGLGSSNLTILTGLMTLGAAGWAFRQRQAAFAATAILIAVIGVTPYLFLYLRAKQGPFLNEADPSTWNALLDVIRRAQYPPRTPFDDPTVPAFTDPNPGRTLELLGYQFFNYVQYFDWQWGRGLAQSIYMSPARLAATLAMASLGLRGAMAQRRADRPGFALMAVLFVVTGLGLVIYMNFRPGPSIGWERWTAAAEHEVRERDYFFVASFVAWGTWAAIGLADLVRTARERIRPQWRPGALLLFGAAALPIVFNAPAATRRHNADATLARDFARALLQSVPPGGILFTFGDNDTFPLWYAQEVERLRRDVTIVCLALAETPWYIRQLREHRPDAVDRTTLAATWRDAPVPAFDGPIHTLDDSSIAAFRPVIIDEDLEVPLANGRVIRLARGTAVYAKDLTALQILRQNAGRRPVAWSITASQRLFGLGPELVQQGLALVLPTRPPTTADLIGGAALGPDGAAFDLRTTRQLIEETWRFGALFEQGIADLDPNTAAMARTLAVPYAQVGIGLLQRGDTSGAIGALRQATAVSDQPQLEELIQQLKGPTDRLIPRDSPRVN
ncbi:MAG: DUF2723 domain-containing protein [Gemmatimonadales bacterium]|nr:DUF2723 domain-containing protein [Gemmatimonadales bacterium]